ncbi:MAG: RodZ domain-containing protein [Methylotenera sp.]
MTDKVVIDSSALQHQAPAELGEVLLAARNAKNLTQMDVFNSLRLSIKQISALENNDFDALPEPTITRGFIRNYARFLGVDAEPLLASYRMRMPGKAPTALSVRPSSHQVISGKDSQPWLKYILGSILVLLFVVAWFFYMDYMPKPAKLSAEKAPEAVVSTAPSTEMPLPEIALPAAERQADGIDVAAAGSDNSSNATAANANIGNSTPTNAAPAVVPNTTAPKSAQIPQAQVTQDAKTAVKVGPAAKAAAIVNDTAPAIKKVSVSCSEQTWVRVTDKTGKVIFEKMLAAGSTDGFDGEPPFNVVIGNANATKLQFSGKQIDLASYTKSNVAHLTLQ